MLYLTLIFCLTYGDLAEKKKSSLLYSILGTGGLWVGCQTSSASISPVPTSETPSSDEGGFIGENYKRDILLIRNRAARFAGSADPRRDFFKSVSRFASNAVSLSPCSSVQQSKISWTNWGLPPQNKDSLLTPSLQLGTRAAQANLPVLACTIALLSALLMVLDFWKEDGSGVGFYVSSSPPTVI